MGLIALLNSDPSSFVFLSICLIFSLCFHEFSHSLVALLLGDDTSYRLKRTNINPLNHLDPMGTLMILLVGFGWAKPVPVNPYNLKNPRIDMIKIAAAGPISNLILALLGSLFFVILWKIGMNTDGLKLFFNYFIMINIYLGLFNLIPIHPLDGGQIFGNFISKYNPDIFSLLWVRYFVSKISINSILS